MASTEYQLRPQANRIRVVRSSRATGPDPRPQRQGARRQPPLVRRHPRPQRYRRPRGRRARRRPHRGGRAALARSGTPTTVQQLEQRLANRRYSPYAPVPVAEDVPEELTIYLDEHAADFPGVSAPSGRGPPLPLRPAGRSRARLRRPDHRRGVRGRRRTRPKRVPAQRRDREERRRDGRTRTTSAARRVARPSRSTPRTTPSRVVERDRARSPGDDVVLNLDIDVQAQRRAGAPAGLAIAKAAPCSGCTVPPERGAGRLTVVLRPQHRRRAWPWPRTPTFNPHDVRRRDQRRRVGLPDRRGEQRPAQQPGDPGPVRPGLHLQADHGASSALEAGLITPDTTVFDDGVFEVPDCTRRVAARSATTGASATASSTSAGRSPCPRDFYFYDLGARFWSDQTRLGGPEVNADLAERFGFDADTGIDLSERAVRPDPLTGVAVVVLRADPELRGRRLAHRPTA